MMDNQCKHLNKYAERKIDFEFIILFFLKSLVFQAWNLMKIVIFSIIDEYIIILDRPESFLFWELRLALSVIEWLPELLETQFSWVSIQKTISETPISYRYATSISLPCTSKGFCTLQTGLGCHIFSEWTKLDIV